MIFSHLRTRLKLRIAELRKKMNRTPGTDVPGKNRFSSGILLLKSVNCVL